MNSASLEGKFHTGRFLHVTDRRSGEGFLIDTGSAVSILARAERREDGQTGLSTLSSANGSPISVARLAPMVLDPGLRRDFPWILMVADTTLSILGADFLEKFHLLPDIADQCLRDKRTGLQVFGNSQHADS